MKDAWNQYTKKSTTFAEAQINKTKMDAPVLVLCPDPPYKPSFFKGCKSIHQYNKPHSMRVCPPLHWPYLWTDFETKGTYGLPMTQG